MKTADYIILITAAGVSREEILAALDGLEVSYKLLSESVASETGPIKPPPLPDPVKVEPADVDLSQLLGIQYGTAQGKVFFAKNGKHYYEVFEGNYLPRGTNLPVTPLEGIRTIGLSGNDCPKGAVGVPLSYILPDGCGWEQYEDGAFYIVGHPTDNPGPPWLIPGFIDAPAKPDVIVPLPPVETKPVLPVVPGASDWINAIVFVGKDVSDAPSNNPAYMNLRVIIRGGEFFVEDESDEEGMYLYNNLRWFSRAQIEARGYAFGREHLFQKYNFLVGKAAGFHRSDMVRNAEQRITVF